MNKGVVLFVLGLAACGGRITTDDGLSSGSTPSPTTTPTTVVPSPPTRQPAPGPVPTAKPAPGEKSMYTAHASPGGYDHLQIYKSDFTTDQCIELHLVSPSKKGGTNDPFANVSAPDTWVLQSANRSKGAPACSFTTPKQKPISEASDGKGEIAWKDGAKVYPCKVNVHVALIFDDAPTVETLDADQISVDGC